MKRMLSLMAMGLMLVSCEPSLFVGYIVHMEYIPEHMSDQTPKPVVKAGFVPIIVPKTNTPPSKVGEKYVIYAANKTSIRHFNVSKEFYDSKKPGDKITLGK